jgi:hypothetical protein
VGTSYRTHVTKSGLVVRSGLEIKVAEQLEDEGVKFEYEPRTFEWEDKQSRARCLECGSKEVYQRRKYLVDFAVGPSSYIETKGRLTSGDRKLLKGVRECNPDIDLRLIFDRDNKLSKQSKTRYSEWAAQFGFAYAIGGRVPPNWIKEWTSQ